MEVIELGTVWATTRAVLAMHMALKVRCRLSY
jgi:hypothetical protein